MRRTNQGPPSAVVAGRVVYRKVDVLEWIDAQFDGATAR
jgi:hypothetical protein